MKVHPEAVESLKRYKDDLKAGHKDAAEYWRGQAGAYFTANPTMKIKPEHYSALKTKIYLLLDSYPEIDISKALTSMGYRWDIYWASKGAFSNAPEYHYLNDSNIDTALKHMLSNYQREKVFTANPRAAVCECENIKHEKSDGSIQCLGTPSHVVSTDYGPYKVCSRCLQHIPYRGEPKPIVKNPLLASLGSDIVTGVGIGTGFQLVDWGRKKIMKNPDLDRQSVEPGMKVRIAKYMGGGTGTIVEEAPGYSGSYAIVKVRGVSKIYHKSDLELIKPTGRRAHLIGNPKGGKSNPPKTKKLLPLLVLGGLFYLLSRRK